MTTGAPARVRRRWLVWVLVLVALLAAALALRPSGGRQAYDPRSAEPSGTKALVLLLESYGRVDVTDDVPGPQPLQRVLVLQDRLGSRQRQDLLDWVDAGGTLVVADAASSLHGGVGTDGGGQPVFGEVFRRRCTMEGLDGLDSVDVGGAVSYRLDPSDRACFGDGTNAFAVEARRGAGRVIALGSPDLWTNELLDQADNAGLAADLLAPGPPSQRVVVLEGAIAGSGDRGLLDLVSPQVWQALAQLGVAFVLVALWRGRRLGDPVVEDQQVVIAGSELVEARADLLRRGRHHGEAARVLRAGLDRDLRRHLGMPRDASIAALDAAATTRAGVAAGTVSAVLAGEPVHDEAGLVRLTQQIDDIRRHLP